VKRLAVLVTLAVTVVLATTPALAARPAPAPKPPKTQLTQKVLWLWLENKSYGSIVNNAAAPYLNSLSKTGVLATQSYGITHPSAPNYIGATSGIPISQLPATDCTSCKQPGDSIFTQTNAWRAFQESMTQPCQLSHSADGMYVPRHNPPTYFTQLLQPTKALCDAGDRPLSEMDAANLPAFTFVTPNLADDMHSGSIAAGDSWTSSFLAPVLSSADYRAGNLTVVVTFDEGTGGTKGEDCAATRSEDCHIPTWFLNARLAAGTQLTQAIDHYDVLATTEDLLQLQPLGSGTSLRSVLGL
jgi:phosphatidylinositol-3-phosphatase